MQRPVQIEPSLPPSKQNPQKDTEPSHPSGQPTRVGTWRKQIKTRCSFVPDPETLLLAVLLTTPLLSRHVSAEELGLDPVEHDEDTVSCYQSLASSLGDKRRRKKKGGDTYC